MKPTIQVESITFHRNEEEDTDGRALYLVLRPCVERPCQHVCEAHPEMEHHYEMQRFRRGGNGFRRNSTQEERDKHHANVWGWDGNASAPTLTPSFLGDRTELRDGFRIHLHLTGGRIDLCGDSTVEVHPSPLPCRDRE